jgi:hypothetical protein
MTGDKQFQSASRTEPNRRRFPIAGQVGDGLDAFSLAAPHRIAGPAPGGHGLGLGLSPRAPIGAKLTCH